MGYLFYPPDNENEVLSGLILVTSSTSQQALLFKDLMWAMVEINS